MGYIMDGAVDGAHFPVAQISFPVFRGLKFPFPDGREPREAIFSFQKRLVYIYFFYITVKNSE